MIEKHFGTLKEYRGIAKVASRPTPVSALASILQVVRPAKISVISRSLDLRKKVQAHHYATSNIASIVRQPPAEVVAK